jgi:YVTN family beta-propeller protein
MVTWQSDHDGDYIAELGGSGTIGSGTQLASGRVTANTPVDQIIIGAQLEFGATKPLWIYVTSQSGQMGSISLDLSMKPLVSIPIWGALEDIKILPGGQKAYVSDVIGDQVFVIDTDPQSSSYNTVTSIVPVGIRPHGIASTPDGTRVYVTNRGSTSLDIDTISVISTSTDSVIATIPLRSYTAPEGIAITPDGTRGYFTTFEERVIVIDTDPGSATYNHEIDSIDDMRLLYGGRIAITPDGSKAIVNSGKAVSVIDVDRTSPTYNLIIGNPVPIVSRTFADVAISSDSAFAYATNGENRLCKIDLQTFEIIANGPFASQSAFALTPDDKALLMGNVNSTRLSVIDASDLSVVAAIEMGTMLGFPGGIAITPDGTRAYVLRTGISSDRSVMVPLF